METERVYEDENPQAVTLVVNIDTAHAVFADLVQVEINPEWAIFNFIQKLPSSGHPDSSDQPQAKLLGRYAMTWPHFVRLTQLLIRLYDQHKESARNAFEKALSASFEQQEG